MGNSFNLDLRQYVKSNTQSLGVWVALIALVVFGLLRYDNFGGAYNISSFLNYNAMFIVISVGMCFVILTGGIDLSVGTVAALSSIVAANLSPYGAQVAIPGAIICGLFAGGVNSILIVAMRIPPFIATLATLLGAKGLALIVSSKQTVSVNYDSNFTQLGYNAFGVFTWGLLIAIFVVIALWIVLERTKLGRSVLAVGGSYEASILMGLNVKRAQSFVYLLSGACAGLAGGLLAASYGGGQPLEGVGWELTAIASVVVGGTLLTGGMGSVGATVAGALLLGLVFNLINFENGSGTLNISAYWQLVIRGGFLFAVILLQAQMARTKKGVTIA